MKKIFALLLSVAMVASMFVGIAFAAETVQNNWSLTGGFSGEIGMDRVVTISGSFLRAGHLTVTGDFYAVVQRKDVGTAWPNSTSANLYSNLDTLNHVAVPIQTNGQFAFAYQFKEAGDYRVVVHTGNNPAWDDALNVMSRVAGTPYTLNLGTVTHLGYTLTTDVASTPWGKDGLYDVITVKAKTHNGTAFVNPGASNWTIKYNTATLPFSDAHHEISRTWDAATETTTITIRRLASHNVVKTGTLEIIAQDGTPATRVGSAFVSVTQRSAFNVLFSTLNTPRVGTANALYINYFNAAGDLAQNATSNFYYVSRTISGTAITPPSTATIFRGETGGATIPEWSFTPMQAGTITATVRVFDHNHNVVATESKTWNVEGATVAFNTTSLTYGAPTTITATVRDAAGNPINNAWVQFNVATAATQLRLPNTNGSWSTTASGTVSTVNLYGAATTAAYVAPGGAVYGREVAVTNGEYSFDARSYGFETIGVVVRIPKFENGALSWEVVYNRTGRISTIGVNEYTISADKTTLVTEMYEPLTVTVLRDTTPVTSGLNFTKVSGPGDIIGMGTSFSAQGNAVFFSSVKFTKPGTYVVRATGNSQMSMGTFTVTVADPKVEITPGTGALTANFYNTLTVKVFDPRNNEPLALPLAIASNTVRINYPSADRDMAHDVQIWEQAPGSTNWASLSVDRSEYRVRVLAGVRNPSVRTIAGTVTPAQVVFTVGGVEISSMPLVSPTIVVDKESLVRGATTDVTLDALDAHGKRITGNGRLQVTGQAQTTSVNLDATGDIIYPIEVVTTGAQTGKVTVTLMNPVLAYDHATSQTVAIDIPVVAAPRDTTAPVITVTAPETTKEATANVVVVVTDNVNVTGIIFDGTQVAMFDSKSFMFARTVSLKVGVNSFIIMATDKAGNVTTQTVDITREAVAAPPAPPADTARPTIEVTAPSVTTDASAMLTIVARDNVAVTGMIFDGTSVSVFPAATVTVLRTVNLREGLNSFPLSVVDAAGNVAERIIVIERKQPAAAKHTITIGRANPAIGLDVPANVRNGRLMVPFRWFGEQIVGATVDYKVVGSAEIVTLHKGNTHIELTLNSTIAKINGTPVSLDVAAFATGGRTLVPARFVAETFGYTVDWNAVTDEVTFTKK